MQDTPYYWQSAKDLVRAILNKEVSSEELVTGFLSRIDSFDKKINAVVVKDGARALESARLADKALHSGTVLGPLHGLPITVKESFDVQGLPTTWGYAEYQANIARSHAYAVQKLIDAGAIVLGKTNVPTALADWQTFNPVYGTTNNPWDIQRTPGGSSGGSAAALACGFSALELGSDIGASIRNPAHYCGVYGHKPTWGIVSMAGHEIPSSPCVNDLDMAVAGPMARSAHDLALALDVLTTPLQMYGYHGWLPTRWQTCRQPIRDLRIGIVYDSPYAEVDSSVQNALIHLKQFLTEENILVRDDILPVDFKMAYETYIWLLRSATGAMQNQTQYQHTLDLAHALEEQDSSYAAWIWRANTLSHYHWVRYHQIRRNLQQQWAKYFESFDLLICPVATSSAFAQNQQGMRWERLIPINGKLQASTSQLFWAGLPGLVGLPATAIPLEISPQGLPIGAQIVGNTLADKLCLRFACWLEKHYHAFVPPPN
ncbi:MAG: amidase [Gammaproteobacteria bacterium]|nr:amidase [Gammaproteobacteria bacterium]